MTKMMITMVVMTGIFCVVRGQNSAFLKISQHTQKLHGDIRLHFNGNSMIVCVKAKKKC